MNECKEDDDDPNQLYLYFIETISNDDENDDSDYSYFLCRYICLYNIICFFIIMAIIIVSITFIVLMKKI